jgi:hypothetical protein
MVGLNRRVWALAGVAAGALLANGGAALAVDIPAGKVLPPISMGRSAYYAAHPSEFAAFAAGLPNRSDEAEPGPRVQKTTGGTWTAVTKAPAGLCSPLLLTDGTVLAADCDTKNWYKLTPDASGNYADGTWAATAALPVIAGTQYQPQYHASAVLPDGRAIIMGGEYNGGGKEVWTNLGAIFDPVANTWTAVAAPAGSGWANIGDAQSTVLANGTFMLGGCCGNPAVDALLDPTTLTWTATGAPTAGEAYQDEQGYELLPTNNVLTIDVWTNYPNGGATNAEQYDAASGVWISAGNTPMSLPDPSTCGNWEIGPAVMRAGGDVVAFGGNTGCKGVTPTDPTAIYSSKKGTWTAGPNIPATCGLGGTTSCTLADAPAALLPDGNILFGASAGYAQTPTHFFELSGKKITQVSDPLLNANKSSSYYYNFLVLPNGQILSTDFSSTAEVYTPVGSPVAAFAPIITKVPSSLAAGSSYTLKGKQLSGVSQGAYYGDDAQMATNYPIVRITNTASGAVVYAKTTGFTPSVKAKLASTTQFAVPAGTQSGASTLVVIANGVASAPANVTVQ